MHARSKCRPAAILLSALVCVFAGSWAGPVLAAGSLKPFTAAEPAGNSVDEAVKKVESKLKKGGFQIVGEDSPYSDGSMRVIGVTNSALKRAASSHPTGGFGAVMRVAVTKDKGTVEVSYTNPEYIAAAYDLGDLSGVGNALSAALGGGEAFGAKGMSASKLARYHYMATMPRFKDAEKFASFGSHSEAVSAIKKAMNSKDSDMRPVWEVTVDSDQTLFGVKLDRGPWRGKMKGIMDKIDTGTPKSSAALPWEILVSGKDVYYLPGKYRIAVMFPDLTMQQFMQISRVPDMMQSSAEELGELAGYKAPKKKNAFTGF